MRFGYNDGVEAGSPKLGLMRNGGADMLRARLSWNWVERNPGQLDWSRFDALYANVLEAGMRPLWVIVEAPCWASTPGVPCIAEASAGAAGVEHADDLGRFAAAVAQRYPESLGLEIGNEVNDDTFWPNSQGPEAYAELLRVTALTVHDVAPDMPVIASGLAPLEEPDPGEYLWSDYMRPILDSGAMDEIDALAFHPYARYEKGDDPGMVVGELMDEFTALAAEYGHEDVPVWVTEIGLSTAARPTRTPEQQAAGLVSILGQLNARGTPVVVIHRLVDSVESQFPLEAGFGVVSADGLTLKPAYCALALQRGIPCV